MGVLAKKCIMEYINSKLEESNIELNKIDDTYFIAGDKKIHNYIITGETDAEYVISRSPCLVVVQLPDIPLEGKNSMNSFVVRLITGNEDEFLSELKFEEIKSWFKNRIELSTKIEYNGSLQEYKNIIEYAVGSDLFGGQIKADGKYIASYNEFMLYSPKSYI